MQERIKPFNNSVEEFMADTKRRNWGYISDLNLVGDELQVSVSNEKYPITTRPERDIADIVALLKKLLMIYLKPVSLISVISLKSNLRMFETWMQRAFQMYPILLKDNYWCVPVKEVRRILKDKLSETWIDIISSIMEYDSAYRFRSQDIAGEINKDAFEKRPLREIHRLADTIFKREGRKGQGLDKFRKLVPFILIYLFFNRKLLNKVKEIVREAEIEKLKLSKIDTYWAYLNNDYDYHNLPYKQRMKLRETI
jgi:hypothetical protein